MFTSYSIFPDNPESLSGTFLPVVCMTKVTPSEERFAPYGRLSANDGR